MRTVWRALRARLRLVAGVVAGVAVAPVLPASLSVSTRTILAWDLGVIVFLALSAHLFFSEPAERMPARAEAQQEGEWTIFSLALGAVVVSFIAVTGEFTLLKQLPAPWRGLEVALVATTLLASWLMTHVIFALRYAHEYYARDEGGPEIDRGLDFPDEKQPDYLDFMYFSLVLGMTFQVSDVQITSRKLRRVATLHGLMSFLFNTVIVALTVNLAAGLL
jgi:uncharacterized membrane protein